MGWSRSADKGTSTLYSFIILLSQCLYRGGRFGWYACRTHKSGGARIRQAKHPKGIDRAAKAAKKELLRSHYRQRYAALVELDRPFCPWHEGEARITSPPVRHPHDNTARMGDKAKPLAAYRRRLCCLGRQPALIPVVPAVPIMMVVMMVGVVGVEMTVVGIVTVPSCGWSRAADYDCADNA